MTSDTQPLFFIILTIDISLSQVPARVALGVTTLLAMSTTQASIQNSLPPVAYTKAIDVWSGVCVFFVFGALLEYAMVNYASRCVSVLFVLQNNINIHSAVKSSHTIVTVINNVLRGGDYCSMFSCSIKHISSISSKIMQHKLSYFISKTPFPCSIPLSKII